MHICHKGTFGSLCCQYINVSFHPSMLSKCITLDLICARLHLDSQVQVPLYVATKMASIRRSSFLVPSPETYARAALRWIGYEPRCTPYWPHSLVWCLLSVIPEFVIDQWRLGFCMNIRKRGQLKDAQKKLQ